MVCLLYTSDAADDLLCVDFGGRRIIKKKICMHALERAAVTVMILKNRSKQKDMKT